MPQIEGAKKSDVHYVRFQFRPQATCLGKFIEHPEPNGDLYEGCNFYYPYDGMFFPPDWRQIRQAAKNHAFENPDHLVLVDILDRTQYSLRSKDFEDDDSGSDR